MKTLSLKLPDPLDRKLAYAVSRRRVRKSDLVRKALEAYLDTHEPPARNSVLERMGDRAGCASGPRDLSVHPKHMKGFGK